MGIESDLNITCGASHLRENDDFQHVYDRADMAMLFCKKNGKAVFSFYDESMKLDCAVHMCHLQMNRSFRHGMCRL